MTNAVEVRGAVKKFGRSNVVLDGLDMTVGDGVIYGLLGASGCGKTTLLSCIVGRRKLNGGHIHVLGGSPGSPESGVPGSRVGYMPQDIALVGELTVLDCAHHFGWMYGMTRQQIDTKYAFLETLLDLPPRDKYVKNLSGGQQRRASLAIALIHDPELLILDEPTVGLDPVLRHNIWEYLQRLTVEEGRTVIITTHYIEEASQSHTIGLMRNGKLLEEDTPRGMMNRYNCLTVEQVFLILSADQDERLKQPRLDDNSNCHFNDLDSSFIKTNSECFAEPVSAVKTQPHPPLPITHTSSRASRMKSLLWKNVLRVMRHPVGLAFTFVLPILEVVIFFLAVGGNPRDLTLGVVNKELSNFTSCTDLEMSSPTGVRLRDGDCTFHTLSCFFLLHFNNELDVKYNYKYFDDLEAARLSALEGNLIGVMHFAENFTESMSVRLWYGKDTDNFTVETSEINVWLDMTNRQTGYLIQQQLYEVYLNFSKYIQQACGENPRVANIPLSFETPVFGSQHSNYGTFIAPGVIVTLIFFLAVTVTSIVIITERDEGVWDRTLVAGVTTTEILVSHVLTQGLVMIMQTAEVMLVAFWGFGLRCEGSFLTVTLLLLVQGLCGMCTGFSISVFCDTVTSSNYVSMGSFVPIIVLSGSIWPLEGMPDKLQWISMCLPTTLATQALRNIIEKGWHLFHSEVVTGYSVSVLWIAILCAFSALLLRSKSS